MIDVIDVSRSLSIPGWMDYAELAWLAEQAQHRSRIVELGSFCGRSTRMLAEYTKGTVTAIDTWGPNPLHQWTPQIEGTQESMFDVFMRNIAGVEKKVITIKANHADMSAIPAEWLEGPDSRRPDMVFIDGEHGYNGFKRDLLNYIPRIALGGILCGHDAYNPMWPHVVQVLNQYLTGWTHHEGTCIWSIIFSKNFSVKQQRPVLNSAEGEFSFKRVS